MRLPPSAVKRPLVSALAILMATTLPVTAQAHKSSLHKSLTKLRAEQTTATANSQDVERRPITLKFVDADTGNSLNATVRITDVAANKKWWPKDWTQSPAMRRMQDWWSLADGTTLNLPNGEIEIEAIGGLGSVLTTQKLDLAQHAGDSLTLKIKQFYRPRDNNWWGGNTHLHMFAVSRGYADRYLQVVPRADDLDTVFVSHLERIDVDKTYVSNEYTAKDMDTLSDSVISYGYGQETRHNFGAYGQGYGHALLLDLDTLVEPVSIGNSLTGKGPDAPALAPSLIAAEKAGGTVVWAHNDFGMEDIPNWLNGRIHALNTFDGGDRTHYDQSFYRYLDIGLKVPFSSGTDWFMLDFTRAYVYNNTDKNRKPDASSWLQSLREGRSYITNGPLLEFNIGDKLPGDTVRIQQQGNNISINAKALGRTDFKKLELIFNGDVVYAAETKNKDGHFEAVMDYEFTAGQSGWLAVRIPWHNNKNEMGEVVRAHTSPVYLQVAGEPHFKPWVARGLIAEMQDHIARIEREGEFETIKQKDSVVNVYKEAIVRLKDLITKHQH